MERDTTDLPQFRVVRSLTVREWEVLSLIAKGMTTKEIALAMELSAQTVSSYRKSICRKLNIHSTVELVCEAMRFTAGCNGSQTLDTKQAFP